MSNPQRLYGLQPSRLLCPWNFPVKSTGVGCHCLLRLMSLAGTSFTAEPPVEISISSSISTPEHISISSVQSLSCVRLFLIPWTAAPQASLSITNSRSLLKLMSIEQVTPSNHLILCRPLLLLLSILSSIRVFSNVSGLHIRWPKYWSFIFSISPSNENSGFRMGNTCIIFFKLKKKKKTGLISLQSKGLFKSLLQTTIQNHQFFGTQFSSQSNSHIHT